MRIFEKHPKNLPQYSHVYVTYWQEDRVSFVIYLDVLFYGDVSGRKRGISTRFRFVFRSIESKVQRSFLGV
jgi:hypothetical protein